MQLSDNGLNRITPELTGKIAMVTGGNKGLGFETVLTLAKAGAKVILACRNVEQGLAAKMKILALEPNALIEVIPLDLVNPLSISKFSETFKQTHRTLDILMLNAGVVNLDSHQLTKNGQEMHMAINHLGHFALTGQLFDVLVNTDNARVVTVSSIAYKAGAINFEDISWEHRKYDRLKAYGDSKLANLLFMIQLQKQFDMAGASALSLSAHPGLTATERQQSIGIGGALAHWIASPVSKGCRSQLLAATGTGVKANQFYGPKYGLVGAPKSLKLKSNFLNDDIAKKLWQYSEVSTDVRFGNA